VPEASPISGAELDQGSLGVLLRSILANNAVLRSRCASSSLRANPIIGALPDLFVLPVDRNHAPELSKMIKKAV
jgi:hypothetical protein